MKPGTTLNPKHLYWTRNGHREAIPFNKGYEIDPATKKVIGIQPLPPKLTNTEDVWEDGSRVGMARHIQDIFETQEYAKTKQGKNYKI